MLPSMRHLFDIPEDIAYFNCAYNSPQLKESKRRLCEGVETKSRPWQRTAASFFDDAETIRRLASDIFGGDSDGYAIVPAASYGLSTAARAVEPHLRRGDVILCLYEEFPSNVLPWMRAAKETGAGLRTVPAPADGDWTRAVLDSIDEKVKVVTVSTCHWTNGARIDLLPISKACRDAGMMFAVDATQSLGAMPFSMESIDPDFLVAAGYKWLLSPYGFSLMYVSKRWRDARPLEETWLARANAEDFASLVRYSDEYMPGARRFDAGEKCTATILPGAVAAFEQIKEWGVANIAEKLFGINARISACLADLGFILPEERRRCPHMFGALLPKRYEGNLVAELNQRNIFISRRGDSLRFAPYLHINDNDMDRLLDSLNELIRLGFRKQ